MLTRKFNYKAAAEAWARETERSLEVGIYNTKPVPQALRDLLTHYIDEVYIEKRGFKEERLRLLKIARHSVAETLVTQLKPLQFAQYRDERLKEVSSSNVKKELNLLCHVIETARKKWNYYIPHNPIEGVRRPKENQVRDRRLSNEETLLLLDACRSI